MSIKKLLIFSFIFAVIQSACTVNEIKNLVNNSLVFSGSASSSSSSSNNLYFLFYGVQGVTQRSQLSSHKTLILFGNPGSSSQYLNFAGLGPLILTNNLTLTPNPNSANTYANLLFIDPLGVGFSFVNNTKDLPNSYATMGQQVAYALGEFKKNIDFGSGKWVIVGESSWIRAANGFQNLDDNLIGIVPLAPWGDLYDYGKYAGIAGVQMNLISNSEKNTIESTFTTCYLYVRNGKFTQAHKCYDDALNFVATKSNYKNLFNINLNQTIIDKFAKVQYYLAQTVNAKAFGADTTHIFERQASIFQGNVFAEQAQNYSQNVSYFMRDYLSVKFLFINGKLDYVSYFKATRAWIQSLNFMQVSDFKSKSYENITIDGKVVGQGKSVKQVKYIELSNAGHYIAFDQPAILNSILKQWIQGIKNSNDSEIVLSEQ